MTTQETIQTRKAWDEIAPGYDEFVTASEDWGLPREALRRVALRPGMKFLDVASGSGALSIPAAGLGAEVQAVDLSPAMVNLLKARAQHEGLDRLDARVMDGHALDLPDDTFDVSASQFGVMLFPDLPRAVREMARVTRPGGRVLIVAYGPPQTIEFLGFFVGALHAVLPDFTGVPMDPPPLPFQVADPEVLRRRMEEATLRDVRVEAGVEKLSFSSGKGLWDWVTNSNPIASMLIRDLTADQKSDVQRVLDGMLRERSGGPAPAVLNNSVNFGIGTK
jgi:ubiquinone/menaquinone biosynthesis C-methylase UbiE